MLNFPCRPSLRNPLFTYLEWARAPSDRCTSCWEGALPKNRRTSCLAGTCLDHPSSESPCRTLCATAGASCSCRGPPGILPWTDSWADPASSSRGWSCRLGATAAPRHHRWNPVSHPRTFGARLTISPLHDDHLHLDSSCQCWSGCWSFHPIVSWQEYSLQRWPEV